MAPDARQLMSFDNFNNQPTRNDSGTTSTGSATMGTYIGKVMLGSFPKMLIIVRILYNSVIYSAGLCDKMSQLSAEIGGSPTPKKGGFRNPKISLIFHIELYLLFLDITHY